MTRILGWFAVVVALCVTAAGAAPGSISGYVKNSAGVAQMGATVELLGTAWAGPGRVHRCQGFLHPEWAAAGQLRLARVRALLPSRVAGGCGAGRRRQQGPEHHLEHSV